MTQDTQTVEFWRRRISEAAAVNRHDPRRAALGHLGVPDLLAFALRSARILEAHVKPGARVLDIGCGCGDLVPLLPRDVQYLGIDLVPDFIEEATKCYGKQGAKFMVGNIVDQQLLSRFKTDSRDVVIGANASGVIRGGAGSRAWWMMLKELVRIAGKAIFWSFQHSSPEVWERDPEGNPRMAAEAVVAEGVSEYYSPDNLSNIYPYLPREPKWLLLGGPADAREAQTAVEKWPGIKVVGVDPNPDVIEWQKLHAWPDGHPLVWAALHESVGTVPMSNTGSTLRHGQVSQEPVACGAPLPTVPSVTWDYLDSVHGPFEDAILWMDIEGSELEALQGAAGLLARNAVMLVNVELQARVKKKNKALEHLLLKHGFKVVHDWNDSPACRDRIYVRK